MLPILFTIGSWPVSSFGLFLVAALFAASFVIWRLTKVYDFDGEQVIDIILLTFFGALIFASIYFIVTHPSLFEENGFLKMILINRYPGLSFWGGFIGGMISLIFVVRNFKLNFWQIADFATVGLLLGLSIGSLGCFLGGCQVGLPSDLPIAVKMVGSLNKRFPIQIFESLSFFCLFMILWRSTIRYHILGTALALGLVILGSVKFFFEFFVSDTLKLYSFITLGHILSMISITIGVRVYYQVTKRLILKDLKAFFDAVRNSKSRRLMLLKLIKWWYNLKVNLARYNFRVLLSSWSRRFKRRLNIRSTPKEF